MVCIQNDTFGCSQLSGTSRCFTSSCSVSCHRATTRSPLCCRGVLPSATHHLAFPSLLSWIVGVLVHLDVAHSSSSLRMSLPSASAAVVGSSQPLYAGSSSCPACRSPDLAALFGLSDGLSVAARSVAASERLAAAGVYGTARHRLTQATAAISPLLQRAEEQHEQRRRKQQQHSQLLLQRLGLPTPPRTITSSSTSSSSSSSPTAASLLPSSSPAPAVSVSPSALCFFPSRESVTTLRLLQSGCQRDGARIQSLVQAER